MAQLTDQEQKQRRDAFIEEANIKAWGAACHAAFVEKRLTDLIAQYKKMQQEDRELEASIKTNAEGPDYHTVENREKRATMQKQRTNLASAMKSIAKNINEGTTVMQNLLNIANQNVSLAEFSKDWDWKSQLSNRCQMRWQTRVNEPGRPNLSQRAGD
jgi:hypothetical protein